MLLVESSAVAGDWEDELPVVQDPVFQYRHYVAVAPDDTLYVLWPDWTDPDDTQVMLTSSPTRNTGNAIARLGHMRCWMS